MKRQIVLDHTQLLGLLESTGTQIKRNQLLYGFVRIIATILLGGVVFFILDWLTRFPFLIRLILLVGGLGYLAYWFWRNVWKKWRDPMDDERLSLILEQSFPELKSRLISTVQLKKKRFEFLEKVMSIQLVEALFNQTYQTVPNLPLHHVLDRSWIKKWGLRLMFGILVWGGLIGLIPEYVKVFCQRLVLPTANYPTRTQILDVEYPSVIPEATSFPLFVKGGGEIPMVGQIELRSIKGFTSLVELKPVENRPTYFQATIPPLLEKSLVTIYLGDAQKGPIELVPVPRPQLKEIEVQIHPPAYTGLKSIIQQQGNLTVVTGSQIRILITATKPLKQAKLVFLGKNVEKIPSEMTARDPLSWQIELTAKNSFSYTFDLVDIQDLHSLDLPEYKVMVQVDRPPKIIIKTPEGVGEMSPISRIPLRFIVEDDYKVQQIKILYHLLDRGGLGEFSSESGTLTMKKEAGKTYQLIENINQSSFEFKGFLDGPKISGLTPGQQLRVWIEATDNCFPNPQTQRSEEVILTVLTVEEYQRILLQKLQSVIMPVDEVILDIRSGRRVLQKFQSKGKEEL